MPCKGAVVRLDGHRPGYPRHRGPARDRHKAELLIALSTCSSEAILPQLVRQLEILGIGRPVVGIVSS